MKVFQKTCWETCDFRSNELHGGTVFNNCYHISRHMKKQFEKTIVHWTLMFEALLLLAVPKRKNGEEFGLYAFSSRKLALVELILTPMTDTV